MDRTIRTALAIAAGFALALVALPARACDRRPAPPPPSAYPVPVAPPAAYPAPARYLPPAHAVMAPHRPVYRHGVWQVRELRHEYRSLDLARDRFYATWDGRPWRRDRFEAWYGFRRADLDRRWSELERWRGHQRWEG